MCKLNVRLVLISKLTMILYLKLICVRSDMLGFAAFKMRHKCCVSSSDTSSKSPSIISSSRLSRVLEFSVISAWSLAAPVALLAADPPG